MRLDVRRGLVRWLGAALLAVTVLGGAAGPAFATDECDGAPLGCVGVSSGQVSLGRLDTRTRRVTCPADHPWAWGTDWTTSGAAVSATFFLQNFSDPGWGSFTATNWSVTRDGWVDFYLGCLTGQPGSVRHPADRPGSPLHQPAREEPE